MAGVNCHLRGGPVLILSPEQLGRRTGSTYLRVPIHADGTADSPRGPKITELQVSPSADSHSRLHRSSCLPTRAPCGDPPEQRPRAGEERRDGKREAADEYPRGRGGGPLGVSFTSDGGGAPPSLLRQGTLWSRWGHQSPALGPSHQHLTARQVRQQAFLNHGLGACSGGRSGSPAQGSRGPGWPTWPEASWRGSQPHRAAAGQWARRYLSPVAASSLGFLGVWVVTYTSLSRDGSSSSLLTTQLSAWS